MSQRIPLTLALHPWWQDHCFAGRAVLPAMETLLLLAQTVAGPRPDLDLRLMTEAAFSRFLVLPPESARLLLVVEWRQDADGGVTAALCSRVQGKVLSRLQEHGAVRFPGRSQTGATDPIAALWPDDDMTLELAAPRLYQDLVPFGPSFHSLTGRLTLSARTAVGTLQAPVMPLAAPLETMLGSPFPLDGAMHAACVLGQRLVDFVPFPVGFARRNIITPTRPGGRYRTRVLLTHQSPEELVFALVIDDEAGIRCETVTGLRMRDVSGGRIKPPGWIKDAAS